ncbi:MAG TPA: methyltransferase domain-containing protein [Phycisphaerales bacterium]|nr:methyltransferase domain-containing protein [Phycisphaerales bacterium]HRQ75259.1 methyltransferase domain-containing protein [Phycisphaerales bacterium]
MISKAAPDTNHSAVVEHYARLAPKYDRRWDRYTRRTLAAAMSMMDLSGDPSILDVACGTGRLAQMALDRNPRVRIMGVDLSPEMIEVAKQRIPESPSVSWAVSPAEQLPADDCQFDIVTCANAFHLVADPAKCLAEFRRVLKPGGTLIIIDWCREFWTVWLLLRLSRLFGKQYRNIETLKGLSRTLEAARFSVIHKDKFKATWFWGMMCVVAQKPHTETGR